MARPLVLCGPSGSGKSSFINLLTREFPNSFGFSVSHTTRKPRVGEEDGVHYHFVGNKEDMLKAIEAGEFIESAEFSGNLYGTSKQGVEKVLKEGKICILDIDMQGVISLKKLPELNPSYVFIKPPSMDDLEKRLRLRKTETEDSLSKRLDAASKEVAYGEGEGNFDLVIVNDNLEDSYSKLKEFILPQIKENQNTLSNSSES